VIFFLDHDVPDDVARWLRHRGHKVTCLREELPVTAPDSEVLAWAHKQGAILVTCNRDDFVALQPQGKHPGIVVLIRRRTRQAEIAGLQALLDNSVGQGLENNLNFA
jgi:predicted nuclease of predicted toxin-antitoxin system